MASSRWILSVYSGGCASRPRLQRFAVPLTRVVTLLAGHARWDRLYSHVGLLSQRLHARNEQLHCPRRCTSVVIAYISAPVDLAASTRSKNSSREPSVRRARKFSLGRFAKHRSRDTVDLVVRGFRRMMFGAQQKHDRSYRHHPSHPSLRHRHSLGRPRNPLCLYPDLSEHAKVCGARRGPDAVPTRRARASGLPTRRAPNLGVRIEAGTPRAPGCPAQA